MTATCSFVTNPDCGTVQNLRSHCGYRQMELDWDAPAGGEEATEYLVSYRPASDTHWTTAVATEDCFFLTDLEPNTRYFYRVRSVCSDSVSLVVEGSAYTLGCSATVIPPTGVHSNLPVAYGSYNSYTQQIYLSTEMTGIDTIVGLTFFLNDNYIIDTAPVVVYLANTSKSRFNSGHDYVAASALTEVFDGVVFNNGREVSIHFATPFVREADSNLVVAINKSMDDYATVVPSFLVGNATLRSMYSTGMGSISPSSPSYGTRLNYVNTIRFGTWGCGLPYDTVFVHDTSYITREVHDTMFINNYVHDTVWMTNYVYDTVYINNTIHDTAYITQYVHDTTFVNNYVHDTLIAYVNQYVHDTTFITNYIHDTSYIYLTLYDTTFVYTHIHDTTFLTQYIHDTTFVNQYIHDTLYLTQWMYEYIHDTIIQTVTEYVHDTTFVNNYIHDTTYLDHYIYEYLHDTIMQYINHYIHDTTYINNYIHDT